MPEPQRQWEHEPKEVSEPQRQWEHEAKAVAHQSPLRPQSMAATQPGNWQPVPVKPHAALQGSERSVREHWDGSGKEMGRRGSD